MSFNNRSFLTPLHKLFRHPINQRYCRQVSVYCSKFFEGRNLSCALAYPMLRTEVHSRGVMPVCEMQEPELMEDSIVLRILVCLCCLEASGEEGSTQKCTSHLRWENQRK